MAGEHLNSRTLIPPMAWGAVLCVVLIAGCIQPFHDTFTLIGPLGALTGVSLFFFWNLTRRDRRLPITDLGSFYMLAICAYGAIPLILHLFSGMRLSVLSHGRLLAVDPRPDEFAWVGWMHVIFAVSFAYAYLAIREKRLNAVGIPLNISTTTSTILVAMFLMLEGYFFFLKVSAGIDFSTAYDSSLYEHVEAYGQLSATEQQFVAHPLGMLSAIKIGLIIWLISRWTSRAHRWTVIAVMIFSIWSYLEAPGGRYAIISILLAAILTYHHTVRPVRLRAAVMWGFLLMASFFVANIMRGGASSGAQLEAVWGGLEDPSAVFTVSNEFQISYGSVLELQHNLTSGALVNIPWQIYAQDVLLHLPQQLLPFEKVDPVQWYVASTKDPDFFNYGVIAQAILGLGVLELIVRGLVIGAILASAHNWWIRRSHKFWPTFFYIWLAIALYQSFRNTSFHTAPLIVYQWLPVYVLISLTEAFFRRLQRALCSVKSTAKLPAYASGQVPT